MRYFSIFVLTALCGIGIISCDPCDNLSCGANNYFGQFRIVRATDGADLVFGSTRVYDKDEIKFYSLKGNDTIFLDYRTIAFGNRGYDSILYVEFLPEIDMAYMRLGNGDIDTFNISYNTLDGGKCCHDATVITKLRFNNAVDIPGNEGTQEIKK